jgi:hypothetical protein
VVRRAQEQAHGLRRQVVGHGHDASGPGHDPAHGLLVGSAAGHAVDERVRGGRADHAAGVERAQVCRCALGDHAHDLRGQAEQVSHGHESADARAHADGDICRVERAGLVEQLARVRRDPEHQVEVERRDRFQPQLLALGHGVLACLLEVAPVHDQLGAERLHGGVLVGAVAKGYHDHHAQSGGPAGIGQRQPVVATGGRDEAGNLRTLAHHPVGVHESTSHLERACGSGVLVLDPHLRLEGPAEQRPAELGGWSHVAPDDLGGPVEVA